MKSIKDYMNVNESSFGFFKDNFVNDFTNQLTQIWEDGRESDLNTAIVELFKSIVNKNDNLKKGIIEACKDLTKEL